MLELYHGPGGLNFLQSLQCLELSKGKDQLALLAASVKKFVWSKVLLFLESNWASFLSICEDRPDKAWRRSLICVSMDIAKFFVLPSGKSLSPFKFESLKSYVEDILGSLCIGLKANCSEELFSTFFGNSRNLSQNVSDRHVSSLLYLDQGMS